MNFPFVRYRKIYYILAVILIVGSLAVMALFGLKLGIDFTGGSILEVEFKNSRPTNEEIASQLKSFDLGNFTVQPIGENGTIVRMKEIDEEIHQEILKKLEEKNELNEMRFELIGPTVGKELSQKTKVIIGGGLLAIVVYVAFAFWKVSRPVSSWRYGITSLLTLSFDILIATGIFSLLGHFYNAEFTIPIVTALLVILGYSINNVVVVFDRVRENILISRQEDFSEIVDKSINQTLTRQLNTSLTTLFTLLAIFFLGGETLRYFSLTLILGISFGTFSSIFLAGPILVSWSRTGKKS